MSSYTTSWTQPCLYHTKTYAELIYVKIYGVYLEVQLTDGRKIPGADHPSTMCFLHSVYMQRVVLVRNARIVLVIRKMAPSYDNLFMEKFE